MIVLHRDASKPFEPDKLIDSVDNIPLRIGKILEYSPYPCDALVLLLL